MTRIVPYAASMPFRFRLFAMCCAFAAAVSLLHAQQLPQLLVVGSPHLGNPGRDTFNMHVDDVLTPQRQREVQALVDHLARFKPTRVAVEAPPSRQAAFDERYKAYRAGTYKLTADERDQVGLRLAAQLNLPRVECVDYTGGAPGPATAYDFTSFAAAHDQTGTMEELSAMGKQLVADETTYLATHSLLEWYRHLNQPAVLQANDHAYYVIDRIGAGDTFPGAQWVGTWHARNLIIDEQVRRISSPQDRVLLLFGYGHAFLLKQYAASSGAFQLQDTEQALR